MKKILWDKIAEEDLRCILQYCEDEFGLRVSKKIFLKIMDAISRLASAPNIGNVVNIGKETGLEYRSLLIHKQNNVIYSVHDGYVYIHMICNTREYPDNYMSMLK